MKLSIKQIKKLHDMTLGQLIVDLLHYSDERKHDIEHYKGGMENHYAELCRSLDAIVEVEKIVIEKNWRAYDFAISKAVVLKSGDEVSPVMRHITATARQRAEACLMCLQGE